MSMKRITALFLALMLLIAFFACNKKDANPLIGSWQGEMDLTQTMETVAQEVLGGPVAVEKIALFVTFTFTQDGIFTCSIDETSAENAVNAMIQTLVDCVEIQGMTDQQVQEMLQKQIDGEKLVKELTSSFVDCFYVYKDGKLYTGFDLDGLTQAPETNADLVWTISFEEDHLVIKEITSLSGNLFSAQNPGVLPMTLTK